MFYHLQCILSLPSSLCLPDLILIILQGMTEEVPILLEVLVGNNQQMTQSKILKIIINHTVTVPYVAIFCCNINAFILFSTACIYMGHVYSIGSVVIVHLGHLQEVPVLNNKTLLILDTLALTQDTKDGVKEGTYSSVYE